MAFVVAAAPSPEAVFALAIPFDARALPVGANPQGLSAADCDGDGRLDLVSADFDADTATIFRSLGAGEFVRYATIPTTHQPSGATCADLDGDGRPDLAVASWAEHTLTIYRQSDEATFTRTITTPVGHLPRAVAGADVDRDGSTDILVVNQGSSDVSVLLGDGAGGFAATGNIRVERLKPQASRPVSLAVADFDGDGWSDLVVVSNQRDPAIHMLFGSAFGFRFSTKPVPQTGRLRSVAAGDLDGDGVPDLAVLGVDATITILKGAGDGTFAFHRTVFTGTEARAIAVLDLDDDHGTDLAFASSDSNSVRILRGSGDGGFTNLLDTRSTTVVDDALSLARVRAENEVLFADRASRSLTKLQLGEVGVPVTTPIASLPAPPRSLLLADLTSDGIPDSVVSVEGAKRNLLEVRVLFGNAGGGFTLSSAAGGTCGNGVLEDGELCDDGNTRSGDGCNARCQIDIEKDVWSIDAFDANGDGKVDLLIADGKRGLRLFLGNGRGQFTGPQMLATLKRGTGAAIGDFDGDGTPDIACIPSRKKDGAILVLQNDGAGSFTRVAVASAVKITGPIIAADFDRNGFDDVLAAFATKPRGVVLLRSDGTGPLRTSRRTAAPAGIASMAAADFDEDGYLDVLLGFAKRAPEVWLGNRGERFAPAPALPVEAERGRFAIGDVDGDLHQDLIACNRGTEPGCRVLFGFGNGAFSLHALPAAPAIGRDVRGAAADDFDGDGWIDLAGVTRRDHRLVIHFGGPSPASLVLETGNHPEDMVIADVNGDGRSDLIVANAGSADVSVFINAGGRRFVTLARTKLPTGAGGHVALAVGDVNGDGRLDVAVTQSESRRMTVLVNAGAGGLAVLAHLATGREPRGVAIGRLRDAPYASLAVANRGADSVSVFLAQSDGSFARTDIASRGRSPWDVALPDLNGDGFDDLIVLNELDVQPGAKQGNIVTMLNDGTGGFPLVAERHIGGRELPIAMCVGDFDGDGMSDIAVASVTTGDVMVLHGAGDGTWNGDDRDFPVGYAVGALSCHDADGDGRTDIAFGRRRANDVGVVLTNAEWW